MKDFNKYLSPTQLVWAAVALFLSSLFAAIIDLGAQFGQSVIFRVAVASSVVLATLGHAVIAWQPSPRTRLAHGLAFAAWMVISVSMASFYVLSRSPALRDAAQEIVGDLFALGQTLYTALFGIGLAITLTCILIDEAGKRTLQGNPQEAIAGFSVSFAIGGAIVASSVHLFEFGGLVANQDLFSRVAATAIADVGFLAIKAIISIQLDRRARTGVYDVFDLVAWGVFGLLLSGYLMAINAAAVAAKTAPVLAEFIAQPHIQALISLYGMSPTILLTGFAALSVLTKVVDYDSNRKSIAKQILSGENVSKPGSFSGGNR